MIPRRLLFVSLALTLLTPLSFAQRDESSSSETSNGLRTVTLTAPRGNVFVYLPEVIVAGDTISGTVSTQPKGKDEQEKKQNADRLDNYRIKIVDETMTLKEGWRKAVHVPEGAKTAEVTLSDEQGKELAKAFIALFRLAELSTAGNPYFPPLGQSGRPYPITGVFDGNSANTTVKIRDANGNVIAESPRSIVVEIPKTVVGPNNINVNDNGNATSGSFRALKIDLTAPKTSLLKGESTELHVEVQGLQGITEPVRVQIQNQTPQNINITGGNTQNILINPSQVTTGGTFNWTTPVTGTGSGGFNITGTIPSSGTTATPTATPTPTPATTPSPTTSQTKSTSSPQPSPAPSASPTSGNTPSNPPRNPPSTMQPENPDPPEPNIYSTFADNITDCCKKLLKDDVLTFQDDKGNKFTIDHDKLRVVVGGKTYEWQFTQDGKPLWIEWMFCHLKDHQIFSQLTQVMSQQIQGGKTTESGHSTSISMAGPYRDEKTTRTFYGFQFGSLKIGTTNKEYSVSFSMDEETCKWSCQLFAEDKIAEFLTEPPGSPGQIGRYIAGYGYLNAPTSYQQGAWWSHMYRLAGEILNWNTWLADHPNSADSYQLKQAYADWNKLVKSALEKMNDSASDADRKLLDQMRDLLDKSDPNPQEMNQIFWKFNDLWMRFREGVPPK